VGLRRVLARGRARQAARARAGAARRRGGAGREQALRTDEGAGMKAISMGVHVLDVLVRPVERIPEGQGGDLVEQIRITSAGSAGGTALVLAKLGAQVRSAGAIGTDAGCDMLLALLQRDGVATSLLLRRDDVQTSASVLQIRPDGSRPAFPGGRAHPPSGPGGGPRA